MFFPAPFPHPGVFCRGEGGGAVESCGMSESLQFSPDADAASAAAAAVAALPEGNGRTVWLGLSGGVDSAVGAHLLQEAGWGVKAVTMSLWDGREGFTGGGNGCFGPGETARLERARRVAEQIGIEHRIVRVQEEYRRDVLGYFRREYLAGRTPNPCAQCNACVKFGALPDRVRALPGGSPGDFFATGHYARIVRSPATGRWQLARGADASKDQSYFLARLLQEQLAQTLFPLGGLTKAQVRAIARSLGWDDLAAQAESQDFVEGDGYTALFAENESPPGDFVTRDGRVLGHHRGLFRYTVGQRKGLNLGGGGTPWYVAGLDAANNRVVVAPREELCTRRLVARNLLVSAWDAWPAGDVRATVQIRQRHTAAPATVRSAAAPGGPLELHVEFDEPQWAVTPGQLAVVYGDGGIVLASGFIEAPSTAIDSYRLQSTPPQEKPEQKGSPPCPPPS